ncbi:MAG: adenosine deaminase [Acidobacteriaceae bacterium]|nr:adenosine deaminase [Acidobacteriaceae bacterium]
MARMQWSVVPVCVAAMAVSCVASTAQKLTAGEVRAAHAVDVAKKQGEPELYALLKTMPKGADLHMHLSGAVYAETFIAEAVKQGLCVAAVSAGTPAVPVGQGAVKLVSAEGKGCPKDAVPASEAMKNQELYDAMVDSFSMRAFVPTQGINGHDQFFATFARFGADRDAGDWLDEVATRAATQNEQYLEIMQTPPFGHAISIAKTIGWPEPKFPGEMPDFAKLRDALLAGGLRDEVAVDSKAFADAKTAQRRMEDCDAQAHANPACKVKIHWLYQVLRGFAPQQVFAQTLLGFEVAIADPDVVGINFVMAEDGRVSMQDYHLQMKMLEYLHSVYPKVHITLHAGEIAPGLVPPAGLTFHIREAVELGHAERIGHGVDVLYEDRPEELLKEMAAKHISLELNLTSNDVILGVKGSDHPLAAYRAAHVPYSICTDDEGVSRIDLTHEYVRAVMEQHLEYADLKQSARTSLEHSFMPGKSLWTAEDRYTQRVGACSATITEKSEPSAGCASFLNANEKAAAQWELEHRLAIFEGHAGSVSH